MRVGSVRDYLRPKPRPISGLSGGGRGVSQTVPLALETFVMNSDASWDGCWVRPYGHSWYL